MQKIRRNVHGVLENSTYFTRLSKMHPLSAKVLAYIRDELAKPRQKTIRRIAEGKRLIDESDESISAIEVWLNEPKTK